eukprot:scaffold171455_cov18-Tisochrysis_lutea.AAC.3
MERKLLEEAREARRREREHLIDEVRSAASSSCVCVVPLAAEVQRLKLLLNSRKRATSLRRCLEASVRLWIVQTKQHFLRFPLTEVSIVSLSPAVPASESKLSAKD